MHKKLFKIQNNNDYITVIDIERFKKQLSPKESCIVLCDDCKINNENVTITFLNRTFVDFGDTVVENTNGILGDKILISDLLKKENEMLKKESKAEPKSETKVKTKVETKVETEVGPKSEPKSETKVETEVKPKRGRKPQIKKQTSSEVKEK